MLQRTVDSIRRIPMVRRYREERYRKAILEGADSMWGMWGEFATGDAARDYVRANVKIPMGTSYDDERIVDINLEWFKKVSQFDYSPLYWMSRLIRDDNVRTVVDFGGHIGVKYYAYKNLLPSADELNWNVYDVPVMIRKGRKYSTENNVTNLSFFEDVGDAPKADILFCSGSLQYTDMQIDQVIDKLAGRPRFVMVNKLSVLADREFYTLERIGVSTVAYRISSRERFEAALQGADYIKLDAWELDGRQHSIPYSANGQDIASIGQIWRDGRDSSSSFAKSSAAESVPSDPVRA